MTDPAPLDRFYIVVRRDLSPGLQLAQAVHASVQFSQEWPDLVGPWFRESNYLVVVSVENEDALKDLADYALDQEIHYSIVEEPDLGDSWTAVALQPGETARLLCAHMELALRNAEEPVLEDFY